MMVVIKVFLVGLVLFLVACSSSEGPRLLPGSTTATPEREPTPVPGTPTPDDLITGKWFTVISETKTQEQDGIRVTVKQLRIGQPERLLPDLSPAELADLGIEDADVLTWVIIKVENTSGVAAEFNPAGFNTVLMVDGKEAEVARSLSDGNTTIAAGETVNFRVMFALLDTNIREIKDMTYSIRNLNFHFSDLIARG